jgi:hypothetical protein
VEQFGFRWSTVFFFVLNVAVLVADSADLLSQVSSVSGLPDTSRNNVPNNGKMYQNGKKFQMTKKYTKGHKIYQMAV